jgi:hypothetical protein
VHGYICTSQSDVRVRYSHKHWNIQRISSLVGDNGKGAKSDRVAPYEIEVRM